MLTFYHYRQAMKPIMKFIDFIIRSPAMAHPHKRTVAQMIML